MEHCTNGTLLELVMNLHEQKYALSEELAAFWFKEIIQGFQFMHSRGYAHLNVSNDNICLDSNLRPKLGGLGLTR